MAMIVFGGNGFVGQHLIAALKQEYSVISCDLGDTSMDSSVPYIQVDIRKKDDIQKVPMGAEDIVVNLVANQYHGKVPKRNRDSYFFDTNATGAENILSVAMEAGCRRFIQFTTDMIYGKPQYLPVDTQHPQNPFGPYGQSKKETERICQEFRKKRHAYHNFPTQDDQWPWKVRYFKKTVLADPS